MVIYVDKITFPSGECRIHRYRWGLHQPTSGNDDDTDKGERLGDWAPEDLGFPEVPCFVIKEPTCPSLSGVYLGPVRAQGVTVPWKPGYPYLILRAAAYK
jgi:hypothetical protein